MFDSGPSMGGGFDFMFTAVPIFMGVILLLFVIGIISSIKSYRKNARSPRETYYVKVVSKRTEVRSSTHHHHDDDGHMTPSHSSKTYYYITLEFDDGSRKEYVDVKKLYGLVAEGDYGYAAVQGDWFVDFERNKAAVN
ncbi:DUF2500 domain-containing protein [Neobacillus mesonae]|nr:DUF2500 domain-containing protein [Neobacillus mesonae]